VPHNECLRSSQLVEEADDISGEQINRVINNTYGFVTQVVAPLIRYYYPIARRDEVINLVTPREPELRKAVEEYQRLAVHRPGKDDVQ
jgi:hypothetical protein